MVKARFLHPFGAICGLSPSDSLEQGLKSEEKASN
jgi:hypothetical protein